ncbi:MULTISPECIES: PadR family transcriptional regulator [Acetobacterales]|uniref:PadR family transcriptional regulator n=2 Tax=Roseomonas TaxID=125216 RepID=A0A2C7AD12_9PROT|nr:MULTISPECIES: PadR family transcriptional regulator [Acetobacteraceae]MBI0435779.1 PadR family transcriptional regulator [Roseomonas sp. KE0001]MDT8278755.1 PadR family transcriptional regulator [Roseomonas mucosa]PHK94547.1 PadR family transcriptional regulator [Pseudoroseomonas rhizosphaerae]PWC28024.1 PadR family transcriptional regulator [Pseudoroseomonas aestuarii]
MSKEPTLRAVARPSPDFTDRAYWAGTIKMALSRFFVLQVLHDGPAHGYDIARAVERTTNGCCSPSEGALYPTLREFEQGGYLTSASEIVSGRERKVYTLTDRGRDAFKVGLEAWMDATAALTETDRAAAARDQAKGACRC